jgi:hypothetical protein
MHLMRPLTLLSLDIGQQPQSLDCLTRRIPYFLLWSGLSGGDQFPVRCKTCKNETSLCQNLNKQIKARMTTTIAELDHHSVLRAAKALRGFVTARMSSRRVSYHGDIRLCIELADFEYPWVITWRNTVVEVTVLRRTYQRATTAGLAPKNNYWKGKNVSMRL